jgi:hypothetical protein
MIISRGKESGRVFIDRGAHGPDQVNLFWADFIQRTTSRKMRREMRRYRGVERQSTSQGLRSWLLLVNYWEVVMEFWFCGFSIFLIEMADCQICSCPRSMLISRGRPGCCIYISSSPSPNTPNSAHLSLYSALLQIVFLSAGALISFQPYLPILQHNGIRNPS